MWNLLVVEVVEVVAVVVVAAAVAVAAVVVVVVVVVVVTVVVVFDCLLHSLLIAKLHAYGFDKTSTEFDKNSILGSPIFNIFLCDLFLFKPNIDLVSYADNNILFAMGGG